jgi:serine/threonine protein kinase
VNEDPSPVRPGDLVGGKYRIERTLGAGGMGIVVAARQMDLDRRVALKFLHTRLLDRPGLVTRFSREARAAAKLESEHVARVLDVGALDVGALDVDSLEGSAAGTHTGEGGAPFIVMEYLEGCDLASLLAARGPLPPDEAVGLLLEACEAVAEAHSLGIIHRDLKPGNLFLANRTSGPPIVKVLDFGLSKFAQAGEGVVTSDSSILGSPLYMSPEQLMSASTVDVRTDIWSLGVVLYELLTANSPFEYERMAGLVAAILQKPSVPIEQRRPEIQPGLGAAIARCLQKEPDDRYPSVAHMATALAPYGPPASARSIDRIKYLLRAKTTAEDPPAGASPMPFARTEPTAAFPGAALPATAPSSSTSAGRAGPAIAAESVAGSSHSITPQPPTTTLPSPTGASKTGRPMARGALGAGVAACAVAVVAFAVRGRGPEAAAHRDDPVTMTARPVANEEAPSSAPRVATGEAPSPAPSPPPAKSEAPVVAPAVAADLRLPPHAMATEPPKKPARVGAAEHPLTDAGSSAQGPTPVPSVVAPPEDPLRRLRPM